MKRCNMRGVTLLELMFVIGIMGIILGFTSLGTDVIRRERVASATRELYADLLKARLESMTKGGMEFGIRLESRTSYVLFTFNDCNNDGNYDTTTCASGTREEKNILRKELHPSLALHKTNPSTEVNNDVRIYDRFGAPRWSAGGIWPITIFVKSDQDDGLIRCISISTNRIREGTWSGSECS